MRRPFSILMFQTVARAKDQCQLARNETQVWCQSVSKEKSNIFWRSDSLRIFSYLFFVASSCLPFDMNSFSTSCFHFFSTICIYATGNFNWTRISRISQIQLFLSFCLADSRQHWIVKVLEIRYYYKMPDLFRTCPC